jgi:23S rRNA (uridine2552-2'-O)-methyltransferase
MERLKREKRRKPSSRAWLERQINDPYVARAKREGFRSRAAYKLAEIDDKFHLFKPGTCVVDLGSAPGGWSEVAARRVGASGRVVALDILDMKPVSSVEFLKLDFLDQAALDRLKAVLGGNGQGKVHAKAQAKVQAKAQGKADVVLSDMAANATGHRQTDHLRIMALAEAAAQFARGVLSPGGSFLCKVLQGGTETSLLSELKRDFLSVKHVKPPASRSDSAELYLLARGFRGGG